MKNRLFILFSFVSLLSFSQTTINGYCVLHEFGDSSIVINRYFSTEVYNDQGERVYKKISPLGNTNSEFNINYNIGNSNDYIHENVIGTDTARYYYIHDTLNLRSYIIAGNDTSYIYKDAYQNGLKIQSDCLFGCQYREEIHYNQFGLEDTVLTIYEKGDTTYAISVYDNQNRPILYKPFLQSPSGVNNMQVVTGYNDSLNTKTVCHGGCELTGEEGSYQKSITYYDEDKIPIKKELIFSSKDKREYYLVIYKRE